MFALGDDLGSESFEDGLVGKVANKPRPLLDINDVNSRSFLAEAVGTAFTNALRPTGDDHHFAFEFHYW